MDRIKSSEEIFGGRLLQEVEDSEESLESLLSTLTPHPAKTHIPSLDELWSQSYQNQSRLSVSGRQLPLLIHILTGLLRGEEGEVGKCVVLIDINGRFSPSFLAFVDDDEDEGVNNEQVRKEKELKREDLKHLHIFRPSAQNLECTLRGIEKYMLYGEHDSYGRKFGGTILFGFDGSDGGGSTMNVKGMGKPEVVMGWRGWLRVEREEVGGFGAGVSAEEMLGERSRKEEVVRRKGWRGMGDKGGEVVWRLD